MSADLVTPMDHEFAQCASCGGYLNLHAAAHDWSHDRCVHPMTADQVAYNFILGLAPADFTSVEILTAIAGRAQRLADAYGARS